MLSRRLLTIGLSLTVIGIYLLLFEKMGWCIGIIALGSLLAINAFIFEHQLNWWWYKLYPPNLDPSMDKMFLTAGRFYKSLDAESRKKFGIRAKLFVEEKEFIGQGVSTLAEDVKFMVAYYAVMVTFHKSDFLFRHHRRIVIYLHPFLTPDIPDHVHTYELEHTDGTIIFSLEQLTAGFFNPSKYYQIGLHAFAELFARQNLREERQSENANTMWTTLQEISGWSKDRIEDFTGIAQSTPVPVMIHHWFAFPEKMKESAPQLFDIVSEWMKKGP